MVELLECTIRDGGYAIDFQWTQEDIKGIVAELSAVGFGYIEVGHGIGLGGSRKSTRSLCSDERHIDVAVANRGEAKIGTFFIPGIGTEEDMKMLADHGGQFVRVGSEASRVDAALQYIELAGKLGLEVFFNFMKSYASPPFEILKHALTVQAAGAQRVSVVDSAGGMLPEQVATYVDVLVKGLDVPVGFHGHNNLLLANANSLIAAQHGADMLDTTLRGMGRGGGNAQTESMLAILEKVGLHGGIDPMAVADIAARHVSPKPVSLKGADEYELVLGYAQFHSSNTAKVRAIAAEYNVDAHRLIIEVSRYDLENPSESLIREAASQLQRSDRVEIFFPRFCHQTFK